MLIPWETKKQLRSLYRLSPYRESRAAIGTQFEMGFRDNTVRYSQSHTKVWATRNYAQINAHFYQKIYGQRSKIELNADWIGKQ